MDIFYHIPGWMYSYIYVTVILALCLVTFARYITSTGQVILHRETKMPFFAILLTILVIVFLGLRPYDKVFIDSGYYVYSYLNSYNTLAEVDLGEEWFWAVIAYTCKNAGLSWNSYFLVIQLFYTGLMFYSCHRLFPNNVWIGMLFCLSSFSYWGFAVNGLRNGMACSVVMAALTFWVGKKYEKVFALFLFFLAVGIHRSTLLPCAVAIVASAFWKKPQFAFYFWLLSIVVSLTFGNSLANEFADLGYDERMQTYLQAQYDTATIAENENVGTFRLDFLLYSMVPIILFYYLVVKRNFKDKAYSILAMTYIFSNAFWVMIIRVAQSNRFAYLSWFLYPIVMVYPLVRFNIWKEQDKYTATILLLYGLFTVFMFVRDLFRPVALANF